MKYLFAVLGLLVAALLLWVLLRPADSVSGAPFAIQPEDDIPAAPMTADTMPPGGPGPAAADESVLDEEIELDPDAIASLRGGRLMGDPRTPPIGRDAPREQPSADELADPEKYAEYEARQERKIKRAYVVEAEKYVTQLRGDIEKGKAMGIPPEEIAKVEEKVRRIEEMRAKLLAEDPALLDSN